MSEKMVAGTLYGSKDNFRVQKVLVAAKYSGKDLDLQDNFDPNEFVKKFPIGNQTGLEIQGSDGKKKHLCQSLSIAYFISDEAFKGGQDELAKVLFIRKFHEFCNVHIF